MTEKKGYKMSFGSRQATIGLPGNKVNVKKQKTVGGNKYIVKARAYCGTPVGWDIYKNDEFVRFHNGKGLKNPFDPVEMIEWTIKNL